MTHPDTLQRAAFEAWAASKHIDTTRDGFGGYESRWTEGASEGWRAAQAALEPVAWSNASWLSNPHAGHFSAKKTDSFNVPLYTSPPDPGGLLRDALSNLNDLADQKNAEIKALRAAIAKLHAAKGRYHTQLAACELFDAVGLKNERPVK